MAKEIESLLKETEDAFNAVLTFHKSGKTRASENYALAVHQTQVAHACLKLYKNSMRSPKHWVSQNGEVIAIKDLQDSHLGNILRMLKRNAQAHLAKELWEFDENLVNWLGAFEGYELKRTKNLIKEASKRCLHWDYEHDLR